MQQTSRVRVFVLSPARLDGARAKALLDPGASSPLALALRTRQGAPIGEVFRFVSSLYFRGKLTYARHFARPPPLGPLGSGALVMTSNRGIVPAESRVTREHLEVFAETDLGLGGADFRAPLARDAARISELIGDWGDAVLLGSIASQKYVEPLLEVFGARLLFPTEFVGRGDMSRGGLLLRAVEAQEELRYAPVQGAERKGTRPPKLAPRAPEGSKSRSGG